MTTPGGFNLGTAQGTLTIDTSQASRSLAGMRTQLGALEDSTSRQMQSLATNLQTLGTNIVALSAPINAMVGSSVNAAIQFEEDFTGVRKTIDATDAEFAQFRDTLEEMATSDDSLVSGLANADEQLARIAELGGQMGIVIQDLPKFTNVVGQLRISTNIVSDQAVLRLAQFMNVFQTAPDDVDRLASTIVDLGNNMATTEMDILNMSQRLQGAANTVGLNEEQTLALSAALSSVGIRAEEGGSSFSRVLERMQEHVETGSDKIETWAEVSGMSADEFAQSFEEEPIRAVQAFMEGLGGMLSSGEDVSGILEDLDLDTIRVTRSLKNLGSASGLLNNALDISATAWEENNALTEEATRFNETLASEIRRLGNKFRLLQKTIGRILMPTVEKYVERASEIVEKLTLWAEQNPKLVKQITKIGAILAIVGGALVVVGTVIGTIVSGLAAFGGVVTFLVTSPIPAFIAGVGTLAYYFRDRLEPVVTPVIRQLKELGNWIIGFATDVRNFGLPDTLAMLLGLKPRKRDPFNADRKGTLAGLLSALGFGPKTTAKAVVKIEAFFKTVRFYLTDFMRRVERTVMLVKSGQSIFSALFVGFADGNQFLEDFVIRANDIYRQLRSFILPIFMEVRASLSLLQHYFEAFIWLLRRGVDPVEAFRMSFGQIGFIRPMINAFIWLRDILENRVFPTLRKFVTWATQEGIPRAKNFIVNSFIPGAVNAFNKLRAFVVNRLIPGIRDGFNRAVVFMRETLIPAFLRFSDWIINDAYPAVRDTLVNKIIPMVIKAFGRAKKFVTETLIPALMDIWDMVRPKLVALKDWFLTTGLPNILSFIEGLRPRFNNFIDMIRDIWDRTKPKLMALYKWLVSEGLPKAWNWIQTHVMPVVDNFIGLVGDIWNATKGSLKTFANWFRSESGGNTIHNWFDKAITRVEDTLAAINELITAIRGVINDLGEMSRAWQEGGASGVLNEGASNINQFLNSVVGAWNKHSQAKHEKASRQAVDFLNNTSDRMVNFLNNPLGRAGGGPVMGGRPYVVGEEGPELFVPGQAGNVIPNGGAGININNLVVNANTPEQARVAAQSFVERLETLRRERDIR